MRKHSHLEKYRADAENSYTWAGAAFKRGDHEEARKQLTQAVGLFGIVGDKEGVTKAKKALARLEMPK